jgi:GTPase SAR1 family protein
MKFSNLKHNFLIEVFHNLLGSSKCARCLVGDAAVGKTSILRSYMDEGFTGSYGSTIGRLSAHYPFKKD